MSEQISKRITLLKRKVDLSLAAFRLLYEDGHARQILAASRAVEGMPQRLHYRRNYLALVDLGNGAPTPSPVFDVLSEA